jgi:hypothetical protein
MQVLSRFCLFVRCFLKELGEYVYRAAYGIEAALSPLDRGPIVFASPL